MQEVKKQDVFSVFKNRKNEKKRNQHRNAKDSSKVIFAEQNGTYLVSSAVMTTSTELNRVRKASCRKDDSVDIERHAF